MGIPFDTKFMALSWTTGELFCLVFLRWLLFDLLLNKRLRQQTAFFLFCGTGYVLLVCILYGGTDIFCRWLDIYGSLGWFCTSLLWKFFVTLWVGIEGVCVLYALRIYHLVKLRLIGGKFDKNTRTTTHYALVTAIFLLIIFAFYSFYHFNAIHVFQKYGLTTSNLNNMSKFYLRICGVLFIIIEWAIAVIVFKSYVLLKRTHERN